MKDDYENPAENPQVLADFISEQTGVTVTLYPVTSEGAIIEALRFGNADIAFKGSMAPKAITNGLEGKTLIS